MLKIGSSDTDPYQLQSETGNLYLLQLTNRKVGVQA
jgi:hypothetical protein